MEDRKAITKRLVAKRLQKSLLSYKEDIEHNMKYLYERKPENILKRM